MDMLAHQTSMSAGEVSPDLYGRVDQEFYQIGMRTVRNCIVKKEGGVMNRGGSRFTAECKDSTRMARLIPFQFNELQTYALEFGRNYMRVVKDGGQVLESATMQTVANITASNPAVVTTTGPHPYLNGEDVYLSGIIGMVELNGRSFRVQNKTATTFELHDYSGPNINSTGYGAYTSGGTVARIYTLATPWTEDAIINLTDEAVIAYAQSNDVLTVVHNDYYPMDITRTNHDAWTVAELLNTGGPFLDINVTATTVYSSATTGAVTLTASADLFNPNMIGDLFYIQQEPVDVTVVWEAGQPFAPNQTVLAGTHYYLSNTFAVATAITAITAHINCTVTSAGHGLAQGDYVFITGVAGMTQVNDRFFRVANVSATTFRIQDAKSGLQIDSSSYTAYTSGGTVVRCKLSGTVKPDFTEGSQNDGSDGIVWTYLHSGFGIVQIITTPSTVSATANVISLLPSRVVGAPNATTVWAKSAWSVDEGYPAAVAYQRQRLWLANTVNAPNRVDISGANARLSFGTSNPILDDEAISLKLDNTESVSAIRHLIALKSMIALTSANEQLISGKDNIIKATEPPRADVQGANGAGRVKPIVVGNTALYVELVGNIIRSLQYDLSTDSFTGIDLTARSAHLFKDRIITDWTYQRNPLSVIWSVTDRSELRGFTYVEEQKVYAWHRHDTDGTYESLCSIKEGGYTATYKIAKRTINGVTKRYIERDVQRSFEEIRDAFFVDCGVTYDGRNTGLTTMTTSGGTLYDPSETFTLTSSVAIFKPADDGDGAIVFWSTDPDGVEIAYRLRVVNYVSPTVVSVKTDRTLPVGYQGVARTDWEFARKRMFPLFHIEGKPASILADGNKVPNLTVTNGEVTLEDYAAVVHIGLGYVSDLETLDLATNLGGANTKAQSMNVPRVFITAQESSILHIGINDFDSVVPVDQMNRDVALGYDAALPAKTGLFEVQTNSAWSRTGRVCVRHTDPTPFTINCFSPEVLLASS